MCKHNLIMEDICIISIQYFLKHCSKLYSILSNTNVLFVLKMHYMALNYFELSSMWKRIVSQVANASDPVLMQQRFIK